MAQASDGQGAASALGGPSRPLRVAIVGSGPSGFYAADALFKSGLNVRVNLFERLPVPFGLVRFGVAPDHAKIRNVIGVYGRTAEQPGFSFWGNVNVSRDLSLEELHRFHDAVILAIGAETDRRLGIEGEDLPRSYTATAFCSWYNGHPDHQNHVFDFQHETAVVIGQGNVAMDVCRILALPNDVLASTDMSDQAVKALAGHRVRTIHCIGRRGPVQSAFTPKEIAELGEVPDCRVIVNPADLELDEANRLELSLPESVSAQRNFDTLRKFAAAPPRETSRRIILHYFKSPVRILGRDGVEGIELEKNRLTGEPGRLQAVGTGEKEVLPCGLLFRSVGYKGVGLKGAPFDERRGVIPNEMGRVACGLYAVGWIKRGPSGLIGTNKKDSEESVQQLLADVPALRPAPDPSDESLARLLKDRRVRVVSFSDWKKIDAAEVARGKAAGKPRSNFTSVAEMLSILEA